MSGIISVLLDAANKYATEEQWYNGTTEGMIHAMLSAAEQEGWRLAPVEPTEEMHVNASLEYNMTPAEHWELMIKAAPRPWDDN